jgi:hypothetical protein
MLKTRLLVILAILGSVTLLTAYLSARISREKSGTLFGGMINPVVPAAARRAGELKTRAVVLIVMDGFRWQEVFDGPEHNLMDDKHGGAQDVKRLRKDFWRDTPAEGRKALLPFLWSVLAQKGEIYGNPHKGSIAQVTNGMKFSYPGYNEMTTGHADKRIDSNEYGPNPNTTVFEWLNNQPEFHDQVAVFATWDAFNDIFNVKRSGLLVRAGWDLPWAQQLTPREQLLKKLYETTTRVEDDDAFDSFTRQDLLDYLGTHGPRALFVGYGGTDDWAHEGKYDLVLQAAHQDDQAIAELWNMMQAMPAYHDQVTFIVTTDHGRGSGLEQWKNHDKDIDGAENIWIAVIGPDTPALGEMSNVPRVTQSQIAATIAALLGQDYRASDPAAAPPLPVVAGWPSGTTVSLPATR